MKYLVTNLKSHFDKNEMDLYLESLKRIPKNEYELIVCPSAIFMNGMDLENCTLGCQDVSKFASGSYTGEISARQYRSVGCKYAIIGHYERRNNFHDDSTTISKKIRNAFDAGMKVIYCIGESLNDLRNNEVMYSLENQIGTVLNDFTHDEIKNIIIAYEPLWSIGSNKIPEMNTIKGTIKFIKNLIHDYYDLDLDILYGGSINRANIILLRNIKEIDGFIIGASSLEIKELERIIKLTQVDKNRQL